MSQEEQLKKMRLEVLGDVADVINKSKDDFYDKYEYLKTGL